MSLQPEALRLADRLTLSDYYEFDAALHCPQAAAELRRQHTEIKSLKEELETERVRLAACGVVAVANTPETAAKFREMNPEYRSASCDDVAKAVDREMALRAERDALQKRLKLAEAVASAASALSVSHNAEGDDWDEWLAIEAALKPWRVQRAIEAARGEK